MEIGRGVWNWAAITSKRLQVIERLKKKRALNLTYIVAGSVETRHGPHPSARSVPGMVFKRIAPFPVSVAKRFEISTADAMGGFARVCLDHEKIRPAAFKVAGDGKIGFEITFSTEQEALAFRGFEWLRH